MSKLTYEDKLNIYKNEKKEMLFYSLYKFQKFLFVETNLKFRCAFQTLFYCGLRNGEFRGSTWNVIDNTYSKFILKNLSKLYNNDANYYGFKESWYVFDNIEPLSATTLLDRKTKISFVVRVKDIRTHDFRHSCVSLLIDSCANITLIANTKSY